MNNDNTPDTPVNLIKEDNKDSTDNIDNINTISSENDTIVDNTNSIHTVLPENNTIVDNEDIDNKNNTDTPVHNTVIYNTYQADPKPINIEPKPIETVVNKPAPVEKPAHLDNQKNDAETSKEPNLEELWQELLEKTNHLFGFDSTDSDKKNKSQKSTKPDLDTNKKRKNNAFFQIKIFKTGTQATSKKPSETKQVTSADLSPPKVHHANQTPSKHLNAESNKHTVKAPKKESKKTNPLKQNTPSNIKVIEINLSLKGFIQSVINQITPKKTLLALTVWASMGFHEIPKGYVAAVTQWGELKAVYQEGLIWYLPYPFSNIETLNLSGVQTVNVKTSQFINQGGIQTTDNPANYILTQDNHLLNIDLNIDYQFDVFKNNHVSEIEAALSAYLTHYSGVQNNNDINNNDNNINNQSKLQTFLNTSTYNNNNFNHSNQTKNNTAIKLNERFNAVVTELSEIALRDVIYRYSFNDILKTDQQAVIQDEIKVRLNALLSEFIAQSLPPSLLQKKPASAWMTINRVQLQAITPPNTVQARFESVFKAIEERKRLLAQEQTTTDKSLLEARSTAKIIVEDAKKYHFRVIEQAQNESKRFKSIVTAYAKAPAIVKTRLYFNTMEEIFQSASQKIIVDNQSSAGGNVVYLPLDKLIAQYDKNNSNNTNTNINTNTNTPNNPTQVNSIEDTTQKPRDLRDIRSMNQVK